MTASKIDISHFPTTSGVYLMKDANQKIIYVGKAKNLKSRVKQYLNQTDKRYQIQFLMARTVTIDFLITDSEREALLLENSLIKKHKPRYNVFLKDDKTYLGLKVTVKDDYPRLLESRKLKKDGALYFGPFTSSDAIRDVKNFIYKYFKLRTCSDFDFKNRNRPCLEYQIQRCSAPCVAYVSKEDYQKQIEDVVLFLKGKNSHLKTVITNKMKVAAETENFEDAARFRDLLHHMDLILEKQNVSQLHFGFTDVLAFLRNENFVAIAVMMVRNHNLIDSKYFVIKSLETDEEALANFLTQYYLEKAFLPKEILLPFAISNQDTLTDLIQEKYGKTVKMRVPKKGEKKKILNLALTNLKSKFEKHVENILNKTLILENLQKKLHLSQLPKRIECIDNSHHAGDFAVSGIVCFEDGEPEKSSYKKFKIKTANMQDDFGMMKEVIKRRFSPKNDNWLKPNLLLLDGGKGQLSQVQKIFEELNITGIDLIAIAKGTGLGARAKGIYDGKKEEEIYLRSRKNPVILKSGTYELLLLQKIRDEAHRFAITFHRSLKNKSLSHSELDAISGIGEKKKIALLQKFGSVKVIKEQSPDSLQTVSGITADLAKLILSSLNQN